jgi:hypothetical protein
MLLGLGLLACGRTELDGPFGPGGGSGHSAGSPGSQASTAGSGGSTGEAGLSGSSGARALDAGTLDSATFDSAVFTNTDAASEGPDGPGRVLYTSCSTVGALDCSSADPSIRLLCDGMTWNPVAKCGAGMICDTQAGSDHGLCTASDAGMLVGTGGNSPTGVVLYTMCRTLGALDCSIANPKVQVLCDGMTWNPIGECSGQLVCDAAPGPNQGLCTSP